jgi:hypothetical protein
VFFTPSPNQNLPQDNPNTWVSCVWTSSEPSSSFVVNVTLNSNNTDFVSVDPVFNFKGSQNNYDFVFDFKSINFKLEENIYIYLNVE